MSTRSIIAKPTRNGWKGRYCHNNGYPTCRGAQLWKTHQETHQDITVTRVYALSGEWSSYMPPAEAQLQDAKPNHVPCTYCEGSGHRADMPQQRVCNACSGSGMMHNHDKRRGMTLTSEWMTPASDCGAAWLYILGRVNLTVKVRNERRGGWATVARIPWDGPEPNWVHLEEGTWVRP